MSQCVALQADGTLIPTGEPVESCTGYVLVSGSEYGTLQFAASVFEVPTQEQATEIFGIVLGAIVGMYVVGRCAGAVVAMFR